MSQTNHPLVSIVTPCYNSARFLGDCIKSVLAQDYPHVEHIVQDGASADGTLEILQHYNRCIHWVSERDQGQADALDRALKRCRGDIILVLNADDMLLPHAASWAAENMVRFPEAAVIYGDLYVVNAHNEIIGAQFGADPYRFEDILCVDTVIPAQAAFMRREHLEEVGRGADATLDTCPDYEMFVRIGLKFPMRHVSGFLAKYRWHPRPDGRQPRSVKRFVRAKQEVMGRVFHDPKTPPAILKLRRRAYSSLALWGAMTAFDEGDWRGCIREVIRSLYLQPSPSRVGYLLMRLCALPYGTIFPSASKTDYV